MWRSAKFGEVSGRGTPCSPVVPSLHSQLQCWRMISALFQHFVRGLCHFWDLRLSALTANNFT